MTNNLYEIVYSGLRALFLIATPIIFVLMITSILVSAIQTATSIKDRTTAYGIKLLVFVALSYMMLPSFIQTIQSLAVQVFSMRVY